MPRPLPRCYRRQLQALDSEKIERIVAEVVEQDPSGVAGVTSGGDERRLRGIPAIGKGRRNHLRHRPAQGPARKGEPATAGVELPVRFRCPDCGGWFELAARNARNHRNPGTRPRCRRCRLPGVQPKPTAALRRWWLQRFTLDELQELAAAIWGGDFRVRSDRTREDAPSTEGLMLAGGESERHGTGLG